MCHIHEVWTLVLAWTGGKKARDTPMTLRRTRAIVNRFTIFTQKKKKHPNWLPVVRIFLAPAVA
jgi:hypothetical protein